MAGDDDLSRTTGCVLDPVFAQRATIELAPGERVTRAAVDATGRLARAGADTGRAHRGSESGRDAARGGRHPCRRAARAASASTRLAPIDSAAGWPACSATTPASVPRRSCWRRGAGGPPTLWSKGISGDRPILLVSLDGEDDIAKAEDAAVAQAWWRAQGVAVDVVWLNCRRRRDLQQALSTRAKARQEDAGAGRAAPEGRAVPAARRCHRRAGTRRPDDGSAGRARRRARPRARPPRPPRARRRGRVRCVRRPRHGPRTSRTVRWNSAMAWAASAITAAPTASCWRTTAIRPRRG